MGAGRHPVVVVGAGPVGLATAIDLARHGTPVLLLDDDDRLATGSRAISFAKRTLEIFDRLGCGEAMAQKGVSWNLGKVFFREELVYSFNLLAEPGHHRPAFVNLQQYYVESYLLERARALGKLEIRWRHEVIGLMQDADGVAVTVRTPAGEEKVHCDYLVAADGARSAVRGLLGHESRGRVFRDRFLIADVRMQASFPTERWFWFDPPFHPNQSVLLHRQPDNVWRIDFQLGWEADPVAERAPERVIPRVRALLGKDADFELEWVSVYTFACTRMADFRDRRVLFAGDAAHGVSPFGGRGANSGVQDADNLAWKLHYVVSGKAPERLLDSYAREREFAADENIRHSTRSTDFITPKSEISRIFRNATLQLARDYPFARKMVNSGRLSTATTLVDSPLNTPDEDAFAEAMVPGAACTDAPVWRDGTPGWLLDHVGDAFTLLVFGMMPDLLRDLPLRIVVLMPPGGVARDAGGIVVLEEDGLATQRFDATPGTAYLLRPDQHVCARWRAPDRERITAALAQATCTRAMEMVPC